MSSRCLPDVFRGVSSVRGASIHSFLGVSIGKKSQIVFENRILQDRGEQNEMDHPGGRKGIQNKTSSVARLWVAGLKLRRPKHNGLREQSQDSIQKKKNDELQSSGGQALQNYGSIIMVLARTVFIIMTSH